jgi:hypothetical protein
MHTWVIQKATPTCASRLQLRNSATPQLRNSDSPCALTMQHQRVHQDSQGNTNVCLAKNIQLHKTCDNPPPLFLPVICLVHILVPVLFDAVPFDTLPHHGPRERVMVRDNIRIYMSARMRECLCMLMYVCMCL